MYSPLSRKRYVGSARSEVEPSPNSQKYVQPSPSLSDTDALKSISSFSSIVQSPPTSTVGRLFCRRARENSDVLPSAAVAVAVTK